MQIKNKNFSGVSILNAPGPIPGERQSEGAVHVFLLFDHQYLSQNVVKLKGKDIGQNKFHHPPSS